MTVFAGAGGHQVGDGTLTDACGILTEMGNKADETTMMNCDLRSIELSDLPSGWESAEAFKLQGSCEALLEHE